MAKRMVTVRLTEGEYEELKARAEADGRSMEGQIRWSVFKLAERRESGVTGKADRAAGSTPAALTSAAVQPIRPLTYAEQLRAARGEKL